MHPQLKDDSLTFALVQQLTKVYNRFSIVRSLVCSISYQLWLGKADFDPD